MKNKIKMSVLGLVTLVLTAILGLDLTGQQPNTSSTTVKVPQNDQYAANAESSPVEGKDLIERAFQQQLNNVQVQSNGIVKAILRDDNKGSRHQKFILELQSGQTVLVAHNIDLAPRIESLEKGDRVDFYGEYEYSPQGGVIHWTHHDPQKKHVDGWLKHKNKTYE